MGKDDSARRIVVNRGEGREDDRLEWLLGGN